MVVANVYVPVVVIFILWYNYAYTVGLNRIPAAKFETVYV